MDERRDGGDRGHREWARAAAVVRALIYLQSDATYKVVFADSGVEKAFTNYAFGLLDFHKELHWVEGEYNPDDQQRILLKCNYLIAPKNAVWLTRAVGLLCNVVRLLNNIHPLVPLALIAALVGAFGWGLAGLFG